MPGEISIADVLRLPVAERIRLVEDIWDSIAAVPEAVPLTAAQRRELDRRLEAPRPHRRLPLATGPPAHQGRQLSRARTTPSSLPIRLEPPTIKVFTRRSG